MGIYLVLLLKEPHISGCILLGSIGIAMILCGGANRRQFRCLELRYSGGAAAYLRYQAGIAGSYVATRLKSWRNPFEDILGDTWQTANSIIAIGSGGLFRLSDSEIRVRSTSIFPKRRTTSFSLSSVRSSALSVLLQ